MKALIQRVSKANLFINDELINNIDKGLLVLLGISKDDNQNNIDWLVNKIINLRIFNDENNKLNLSIIDLNFEIMVVPNFTLYADIQKGFRPSFVNAAKSEISKEIFDNFCDTLDKELINNKSLKSKRGKFGADMQISLINDGPVTIIIEK